MFSVIKKALAGGKKVKPTPREIQDERLRKLIAAKSSVYNIQQAVREADQEDLGQPLETDAASFDIPLDGIVVEEVSMEEAGEMLEQSLQFPAVIAEEPESDEETVGPSTFKVDELEETGTFFGTSTSGIEVEELDEDGIDFEGDGDTVLTAWGEFNLNGVNTAADKEQSWDNTPALGRDEAMFRRGSS